jgi:hypothetical protein
VKLEMKNEYLVENDKSGAICLDRKEQKISPEIMPRKKVGRDKASSENFRIWM